MQRNEHLTDLVAAVESRLTTLCPLLAAVSRSQITSETQLATLVKRQFLLPAAVVIPGPWTVEDDLAVHANDYRLVSCGILVVAEYNASEDGGTASFWAALDQIQDAMTPTELRGEDERYPVAVLGDQTGDNRGTLLKPAGLDLVDAGQNRCAGVLRLTVIDPISEKTGLPVEPPEPAAPETGVTTIGTTDRLTVWLTSENTWLRRFISGSNLSTYLGTLFAPLAHASRHASTGADALTPAAIGAQATGTAVLLTGNQSVAGAKTFSDLLKVTAVPTGTTPALSSLTVNPASASADANLLWLGVGDALRASIDEDGDGYLAGSLGINCLAPPTRLTVADTVVSSPRGIMSWQVSNSVDGARLHLRKDRGTAVGTPAIVQTGDLLGRVVASGWDGVRYLEMAGIDFGVAGTVATDRVPTYMAFLVATDASQSILTERMRIIVNGNIGIGTSDPFSAHVQINGGSPSGSKYHLSLTSCTNDCTCFAVQGASTNMLWTPRGNYFDIQTNTAGKGVCLTTNGGNLLVDGKGNVAMGTLSPTAICHVTQGTTGPGTVTVSGTAVTGAGTQFTNTFRVGDSITVTTTSGSETKAITAVTSDTVLVTASFSGTAAGGTAYTLVGGIRLRVYGWGGIAVGPQVPTAMLHLPAGTATASTAPLKFTSGVVNTTAELGTVEFTDPDIFFSVTDTTVKRKAFVLDDGTRLTSGKIPRASTNGRLIDGPTPLVGTKTYYVADTSGGAVTRKLTYTDGILTAET